MKQTILLSGATGFLGSRLARKLILDGHTVVALGRSTSCRIRIADLTENLIYQEIETCDLNSIFARYTPEMIVHCATNFGRAVNSRSDVIEANLSLPLTLLQSAVTHHVPVFVNMDTILDAHVSNYSLSKKQFREWLELSSLDIACINVALGHLYGPRDTPDKFVVSLLRQLIITVDAIALTSGEQRRDFLYIDDAVEAVCTILKWSFGMAPGFHHFEAGWGSSVSIKEIVLLARDLTQNVRTKLDFGALPYRPREMMDVVADIEQLTALGWRPSMSIEMGLEQTIHAERADLNGISK